MFSQFVTPPRLRPGIGLRPGGGERPDVEELIPALYAAYEVHQPGIYDLEIETSAVTPEIAAAMIRERLDGPAPTAFHQLVMAR